MGKLVAIGGRKAQGDEAARRIMNRVVDEARPFVMVARNEGGEWELTCSLPESLSDYEVVGVLYHLMNNEFSSEYE